MPSVFSVPVSSAGVTMQTSPTPTHTFQGPSAQVSASLPPAFSGPTNLQPSPVDPRLQPRPVNWGNVHEVSFASRCLGLPWLHERVVFMHEKTKSLGGTLLEEHELYELAHFLVGTILDSIYKEAQGCPQRPSGEQVQQAYQTKVEIEHAKCGDQVHFLTAVDDFSRGMCKDADVEDTMDPRPHDEEMLDTTPSWWSAGSDLKDEIKAIHPLSPPASLAGFPQAKRTGLIRHLYRRLKCVNAKAASCSKNRLLPNKLGQLVQLEEQKVIDGIATEMQNLGYVPTEEQILQEYDSRSEVELGNCDRMQPFFKKVKSFHYRLRTFFAPAREMVRDALCFGGSNNSSQAAPQVPAPQIPSAEQARDQLRTALAEAIGAKNVSVSMIWNGSVPILRPGQIQDLVSKLEQRQLEELLQAHAGAPISEDNMMVLYIQAGKQALEQIQDDGCFVGTIKVYLGLPP